MPIAEDEQAEGMDEPYLGAEEVIEEVITLLARLETDRLDCISKLKQESERVVRLNDKIDKLCLKRMVDMPIVVQRGKENMSSAILVVIDFLLSTLFTCSYL